MKPARALPPIALGLLALLGACAREDSATVAPPSGPGAASTTQPATTTPAPTVPSSATPATDAPSTTAPATDAPTTHAPTSAPTTAPATDAPTTSVAPTTVAPVTRPVLVQYGSSPIGVWDGAWQQPAWEQSGTPRFAAPTGSAVATALYLGAPVTGGTYGAPAEFCAGLEQSYPATFSTLGADDRAPVVVDADWNVQPRSVQLVGAANPEYQAVGEALVDPSRANPADGTVVEVARADLDGNGIEEVLFTFEHQTPDAPFGTAGDFTLIVARYPAADGAVADEVLWSFYEEEPVTAPNPAEGWLLAIADLNGDAVMEVVTGHSFWEAGTATIFSFTGGRLQEAAGGGCGV